MPDFKEYSQQTMHKALNMGADLISQHFQNELEENNKLDKASTIEDQLITKPEREEDSKEEHHADPRGRKVIGKFTAKVLGAHEPEQGRNNP
ncbi:hypothetical protein NF27_EY00120 [Candidatus Jidaibacter acanthamoeba]|uniref:Uncharacterized protein n=1 Tax=Candidatus Jidaibacter acanthamoebae TaxID=86105 RepID=A0A0C1MYD0_9RICK|nr:hypothetical protein [Candidatus Jidaibacter acanthamoeba]KIE04916.1 hypothetical protein NF27_EY00120 [Candidatus Jidaibacter acanthamoeba]